MGKSFAPLLILIFLTASYVIAVKPASSSADAAENLWVSKAPMHMARSSLRVAVVNGKIYAIGGGAENGVVGTNEEYDPATDTWTFKTPMPTPREYFATAVYQNKIYCIGGSTSSGVTGINEVYDPATDTWENKTSMPTARILGPANVAGGKIYLIGGLPNGTLNEAYDPATDTWTTKAPIPIAAGAASGVFNNKIYFVGGFFDADYSAASMTQIYDPITDTWSLGTPPPTFFLIGSAGVTSGAMAPKRIYVFDSPYGDIAAMPNDPLYTNQVYDPETDSWTFGANIPTYREHFGVAVVNDLFYVIGGFTETFDMFWNSNVTLYATNEQYTPFGYGMPDPSYDGAAPEIAVLSPENKTYYTANVTLNFTANEPIFSVHFVLDGGTPVEVLGNTTLSGLAIGAHNVTVFGFDASDNMGTSETVFFAVAEPEPFPTTLAAASTIAVAVVAVGLLLYFKKRKR